MVRPAIGFTSLLILNCLRRSASFLMIRSISWAASESPLSLAQSNLQRRNFRRSSGASFLSRKSSPIQATSRTSTSSRLSSNGDSILFLVAALIRLRGSGTFPSCQRRSHFNMARRLIHIPTIGLYSIEQFLNLEHWSSADAMKSPHLLSHLLCISWYCAGVTVSTSASRARSFSCIR